MKSVFLLLIIWTSHILPCTDVSPNSLNSAVCVFDIKITKVCELYMAYIISAACLVVHCIVVYLLVYV